MTHPLILGFLSSLALIAAIGAQNAFVLRQGLRREHVGAVVALCAVSDMLLITAGVAGFGALVAAFPGVVTVVTVAGAAFLIGYGLLAARRAMRPVALTVGEGSAAGLSAVVASCLAITFLNPHVYLDTVVLLGALAADQAERRWLFGVGAVAASGVWFCALGFGARRLSGLLTSTCSWRVLEALVAVTMVSLGVAVATR